MTLVALLVLSLPFAASLQAALEVYEQAYELRTKQILRWPLRAGDSLVVRQCPDCDVRTLNVTDRTRYSNGFGATSITLDEMLRQKSLMRDGTEHLVVIFFLPDDLQVTRIILQTDF